MKIAIIGAGYVGLVSGACFAELGHEVTCIDIDEKKVEKLKKGASPIFETGLNELLARVLMAGKFAATAEFGPAIEKAEFVFICVGTPQKENGETNLEYVKGAAKQIGKSLGEAGEKSGGRKIIVIKSTVPVGTSEMVAEIVGKESGKKAGRDFGIAMNPEFLREGSAIREFMEPDRIVIGAQNKEDGETVAKLYGKLKAPTMLTSLRGAELIKYASNSFLATKVSFINEIGNYCKSVGIDAYEVARGMGLDKRIAPGFLQAGAGFGGSCFPKDAASLSYEMKKTGNEPRILKAAMAVNEAQPLKMVEALEKKIGALKGKRIAVLGLAFKPNTDDMRDAVSIRIIGALLEKGAEVFAYDPRAMENAKKMFSGQNAKLEYAGSADEAVEKGDAVLVVTEWKEFEGIRTDKALVDGRNIVKRELRGKNYIGLCW